MTQSRKPRPLYDKEVQPVCPVCGKRSYSSSGVHPQCAYHQADAHRMERLKLSIEQQVSSQAEDSTGIRPWHKPCPRCDRQQHIRKKVCECGQRLGS